MANDLNIFQRMALATDDIKSVAKNLEVGYGKNAYKAVGEADVLKAVREAEKAHGIYSYPCKREVLFQDLVERQGSNGLKTEYVIRIKTTYRFVNIDNPSEYIEVDSFGDGMDSQDKACGKAITYSDKYALLKAYKIPTGEDPDQEASDGNAKKKQAQEPKKEITRRDCVNRIMGMYSNEDIMAMLGRLNANSLDSLDDATLRKMAKL